MNAAAHVAREMAHRLEDARRSLTPLARPETLTIALAPLVRRQTIAAIEDAGGVGGYKVSLSTSTWGAIAVDRIVDDGALLPRAELFDPLLEAEIAFRVERNLDPGCTREEVLDACSIAPAIEVADSRWAGWSPSDPARFIIPDAAQIEADNAVAGWLVTGIDWRPARDVPLDDLVITTGREGRRCAGKPLRDVMGGPANAVRWLVGELGKEGRRVRGGDILSSGCPCTELVTVGPDGGRWTVAVEGLGSVSARFA